MEGAIAGRLPAVRARIDHALARSGRDPGEIVLVAVTKTVPAVRVREALAEGLTVFGENRVQEARTKAPEVGPGVSWHLVGHLQSNKTREAVGLFDLIHSVDSLALATEIGRRARAIGKTQEVLLEVNLSGEASKFGLGEADVRRVLAGVLGVEGVRVRGLMTVPPPTPDPELARPWFRRLRELRDGLGTAADGGALGLSMGMSGDFEIAIEEGATWIRIGTALFGERRRP